MNRVPRGLATLGQDSGDIYVPKFTCPGMFAQSDDVTEKALLGVAFPSEYRGLVLGFQARMVVGLTTFLLVDDGPNAQSAWLGLDGLQ